MTIIFAMMFGMVTSYFLGTFLIEDGYKGLGLFCYACGIIFLFYMFTLL